MVPGVDSSVCSVSGVHAFVLHSFVCYNIRMKSYERMFPALYFLGACSALLIVSGVFAAWYSFGEEGQVASVYTVSDLPVSASEVVESAALTYPQDEQERAPVSVTERVDVPAVAREVLDTIHSGAEISDVPVFE